MTACAVLPFAAPSVASAPGLVPPAAAGTSGDAAERRQTLNRLLFPAPAREFGQLRAEVGDLSGLGTPGHLFGLEPGGGQREEGIVHGKAGAVIFHAPQPPAIEMGGNRQIPVKT